MNRKLREKKKSQKKEKARERVLKRRDRIRAEAKMKKEIAKIEEAYREKLTPIRNSDATESKLPD